MNNARFAFATSSELAGLGDWKDDAASMLKQAVTVGLTARQQLQLQNINIKRAEQGLPPLDVDALTPAVKVKTGLDQSTLFVVGGLGMLGLVLWATTRSRRHG